MYKKFMDRNKYSHVCLTKVCVRVGLQKYVHLIQKMFTRLKKYIYGFQKCLVVPNLFTDRKQVH
jgi:hypothetical protein